MKIFAGLLASSMLFSVACQKKHKKSHHNETPPAQSSDQQQKSAVFLATLADLPVCEEKVVGQLFYVEEGAQFHTCVRQGSGFIYRVLEMNGTQGAAGAQGPQGDEGPKGDKGEQGSQGATGGAAGSVGQTGAKGDKGDAGLDGLRTLMRQEVIPSSSECQGGRGVSIVSGLDVNKNTQLEANEITNRSMICDGGQGQQIDEKMLLFWESCLSAEGETQVLMRHLKLLAHADSCFNIYKNLNGEESISLAGSKLKSVNFKVLSYLSDIEALDLSNLNITSLAGIELLSGLKSLNINNTEVANLTPLQNLPLIELKADATPLSLGTVGRKEANCPTQSTSQVVQDFCLPTNGELSGTVTDEKTHLPVTGALLEMTHVPTKATYEVHTDAQGHYNLLLPKGLIRIKVSASAYASQVKFSELQGKKALNIVLAVTPRTNDSDEYRFLLSWTKNPMDLDAHVAGLAGDETFHIAHFNRNYNSSAVTVLLDGDVSTAGTETVTVAKVPKNSRFDFFVVNSSATSVLDLKNSGAKVLIYVNDVLENEVKIEAATITDPSAELSYWNAITIENGDITYPNEIDQTNPSLSKVQ